MISGHTLTVAVPPILLAAYYAIAFIRTHHQPPALAVAVRYDPPADLTPAAARFIWRGTVDQRSVASVLAGLATKGRITITREKSAYRVNKLNPPLSSDLLNEDEQHTMDWLFSNFLETTLFDPQHGAQGCIMSLRGVIDRRLREQFHDSHANYIAVGIVLSFLASMFLITAGFRHNSAIVAGAILFLSSLLAALVIGLMLVPAILDAARRIGSIGRVIFGFIISAFAALGAVGLFIQLEQDQLPAAIVISALALINVIAIPILRQTTPKGYEAKAQIAGFREFLLKVEQDSLDRMIPAGTAPPTTATLLSYAIALEVKEAWGDELVNACYPG